MDEESTSFNDNRDNLVVVPSSPSSSALSDVVSSYHRSQTFLSSSIITTQLAFPEHWQYDHDEEVGHVQSINANGLDDGGLPTPRQVDYDIVDPLWDDALQYPISTNVTVTRPRVETERTPLLTKKRTSQSSLLRPQTQQTQGKGNFLTRRISTRSIAPKQLKYYSQPGNSTYRQTLFNSTAILLGIGMLSEPLAFAYAGWIPGTFLIILYGFTTCYTAKILARFIKEDPSLRTYADIGLKAFGKKSTMLTGVLFCLELFSVSVVLITLYGDSLHLVIPTFTSNQYKLIAIVLLIPTMFLPLSVLAYASVLGILSTILIMGCIMIDGLSKFDAPGSLWKPADTVLYVADVRKIGVAFGLFMAGFGGHAVIPSLVRDMQDPSQFDGMINRSFGIATFIYGIIGAAGYLMFGNSVSQEISRNILEIPEYNRLLNDITVWMLVLAPLTKYSLNTRPLSLAIEIWLGLDNPAPAPQLHEHGRPSSPSERSARLLETSPRTSRHPIPLVIERTMLVLFSVGVSILIPEFSTMMAFLGSFSAFVLCVVGPLAAKIAFQGSCGVFDAFLLGISIVFTVWGTVAAFL